MALHLVVSTLKAVSEEPARSAGPTSGRALVELLHPLWGARSARAASEAQRAAVCYRSPVRGPVWVGGRNLRFPTA